MKRCELCDGEGSFRSNPICHLCLGTGIVNVPSTIYLQITDLDEITWCIDRINDNDLEYTIKYDDKN